MASTSAILLPGQPLPANFTAPPIPQCGMGCYEYGGKILASVVGRPFRDGSVRVIQMEVCEFLLTLHLGCERRREGRSWSCS